MALKNKLLSNLVKERLLKQTQTNQTQPEDIYLDLENLALDLNFFGEPAFLHGAILGFLVVNPLEFKKINNFICELTNQSELKAKHLEFLEKTYTRDLAAMQDLNIIFKPLIAPDFNSLADRFNSISAWLGGFLRGLDKGGVDLSLASDDLKNFLRTALEISEQKHTEATMTNTEENLDDIKILEDFLKLGVLYAYTDWVIEAPKTNKPKE